MDKNRDLARRLYMRSEELGKKIMVIGCGGSGKSTLSRRLGALMNLPVIHLDHLFWRDGWRSVANEEFDALLAGALKEDRWIIDGDFNRTIEMRMNRCDTVLFLDYARCVCVAGVIKRVISYYGKTRPDMGAKCPERFDWGYLKWIWRYNARYRKEHYQMLASAEAAGKKTIAFTTRKEAKAMLEQLMA